MATANDLNISQAGYVTFDGTATFSGRTFQAGTGVSLTNPSGVAGNTTISATAAVPLQFTGNSGVAIPAANNLNVVTANSTVKFVGSGSTLTEDFGVTNVVLGSSLPSLTSGSLNTGLGTLSLASLTSGTNNVALGIGSGQALTSGGLNTLIGFNAGPTSTTSNYNVCVGVLSGNNYTTSESSNILIGPTNSGTIGDNNTIRIGVQGSSAGQQNKAFMAGIVGNTVSNALPVTIDSTTGQLGVGSATPIAFDARLSGQSGAVTGDGTIFPIIFDVATFDTASAFNTGTGLFTAPTTGIYQFTVKYNVYVASGTSTSTLMLGNINVNGSPYDRISDNSPNTLGLTTNQEFIIYSTTLISLTAGDTVGVDIQVAGGTLNIGVAGATIGSHFSGFLVN